MKLKNFSNRINKCIDKLRNFSEDSDKWITEQLSKFNLSIKDLETVTKESLGCESCDLQEFKWYLSSKSSFVSTKDFKSDEGYEGVRIGKLDGHVFIRINNGAIKMSDPSGFYKANKSKIEKYIDEADNENSKRKD